MGDAFTIGEVTPRRWRLAIMGGVVVLASAVVWLGVGDSAHQQMEMTVNIDTNCHNAPAVQFNGGLWDPTDPAPAAWHGDVHGIFKVDPDGSATFVGDDGLSEHFQRVHFSLMHCMVN